MWHRLWLLRTVDLTCFESWMTAVMTCVMSWAMRACCGWRCPGAQKNPPNVKSGDSGTVTEVNGDGEITKVNGVGTSRKGHMLK